MVVLGKSDFLIRSVEELIEMVAATSAGTANVICDESVATGAPSRSTRTERSEGAPKEQRQKTSHRVTMPL